MSAIPVTITVAGTALDPCSVGLPVVLTHGRSGVGAQPDSPSLAFTWLGSDPPGEVGDSVTLHEAVLWEPATYDSATVDYDDPGAVYDDDGTGMVSQLRFVGTLASMRVREVGGLPASWAVECIGVQARLGFIPVVLPTQPMETDVARVLAIATAAAVTVRVLGSATVTLAADSIDTDALGAIHDVCQSSGGLFWQSPDGTLTYGAADHRALAETVGVLPCEAIASGLAWAEAIESVVNHVTAVWGPEDDRHQSTHRNDASIAEPWGLRHVDVQSMCASEADAETLALLVLARRSWPYWGTPEALIYGDKLDSEGERLTAMLDVSTAVLAPFESTPGPVPSDLAAATVEGFVETWDVERTVQVALSDSARWVVTRPRTYTELRAIGTYTDVHAMGTYLDALVMRGAA